MSRATFYTAARNLNSDDRIPLCARHELAAEHGGAWEEPLVTGNLVLEIVEKFEVSLAKLEHGYVGGRAHVERAAVAQEWKDARGIECGAADGLAHRHAVAKKFGHAVWQVDDARLMCVQVPVR